MNLLENMADYLLDCIDEICVHLVEKDMSGAEWPPFFARDLDGRLLEYIDQKQKQAVIDKLRSQSPKWSKDCLWLLLNRIVDDGLAGQRPGTTPADTPQVPGTKTHTVKSDNYSFISDKAEGFQIAHELLHQAGVTHSKDNLLPEDDDGKVDMNGHTPGNARPKTDLMHPVSRAGAKLQAADCAKFRDYTKGHKCCDEV
jgi:hypothetical protein